jgi:hypothetical protein
MLVGLIYGDGCIINNKTIKGYIKINLTIEYNIRDLSILQHLKSILKLSKITVYSKFGTCNLIINHTDIQEVLCPIFLDHKLCCLTNMRRAQFNTAMYTLQKDLKCSLKFLLLFLIGICKMKLL